MNLKWKWRALRGSVLGLTALALLGGLLQAMWLIWVAAGLLIPWVVLEVYWWRCPHCREFLGSLERKNSCPKCGKELDMR